MSVLGKALRAVRSPSILASDAASASLFSTPSTVTQKGAELYAQPERALHHATAYACIRLISSDVGNMPVDLVRALGNFRQRETENPLSVFLAEDPNDEIDANEMWLQVVGWMATRGNAYIYIDWDPRTGAVRGLWPIPATRVWPARDYNNRLMYLLQLQSWDRVADFDPMSSIGVPAENIMHFRNFGLGLIGMSPIQQMAEAFALAMNAEEYGGRFFDQGALPGGIIKTPTVLTDVQWETMRGRWDKLHTGQRQAHLTAVLEGGAEWEKAGVSNSEMQFLELRNFQVEDIARIFGVPQHMVGHTEKATSWGSGIEQQHIGYVLHTLMPYITRIERVVRKRLFPSQRDLSMRFNAASMLRGDTAARYGAYAIGRQWGWLSINDIRALEDMPPVPGGDAYISPLNMGTINPAGGIDLPNGVTGTTGPDGEPVDPAEARARLARLLGDLNTFATPPLALPMLNGAGTAN